jgi:hypothetical protein
MAIWRQYRATLLSFRANSRFDGKVMSLPIGCGFAERATSKKKSGSSVAPSGTLRSTSSSWPPARVTCTARISAIAAS